MIVIPSTTSRTFQILSFDQIFIVWDTKTRPQQRKCILEWQEEILKEIIERYVSTSRILLTKLHFSRVNMNYDWGFGNIYPYNLTFLMKETVLQN